MCLSGVSSPSKKQIHNNCGYDQLMVKCVVMTCSWFNLLNLLVVVNVPYSTYLDLGKKVKKVSVTINI